jgi:hypothetical protein
MFTRWMRLVLGLLGNLRRRTADVEAAHGEPRAGRADKLGGDDVGGVTDLDQQPLARLRP